MMLPWQEGGICQVYKNVAVNEQRLQHLSTNKVQAYSRTFNDYTQ